MNININIVLYKYEIIFNIILYKYKYNNFEYNFE